MKIKHLLFAFVMMIFSLNMVAFAEERLPLRDGELRPRLSAMDEDYLPIKNAWYHEYDGAWIYLDEEGLALQCTWFHDPGSGKWYYFDRWCYMLHDTTTPDGYTVGPDGAWTKDGQVVIETDTSTAANN
jgi:hypothetical protein